MLRDPRYRAECADFYAEPHETAVINLRGPDEVLQTLEQAAERAKRTFNAQLFYAILVCRGVLALAPDDERSVQDWQTLIGQMRMCFHEGGEWIPCAVIFPNTDHRQACGQA